MLRVTFPEDAVLVALDRPVRVRPVKAFERETAVIAVLFDGDERLAELLRRDGGRAAAGERIEHDVAGSVEARMSFAMSFSGFCGRWSVFSGIDQKGTEMSSQKFEAPVRRNFPPDSSLQSFGRPFSRYGAITLRFMRTASAWKIAASSGGATAYQMSSQAFFQFDSAARPFSRCQVMRFRTMKCFRRTSKHAAVHFQSQHRYTAPPGGPDVSRAASSSPDSRGRRPRNGSGRSID